MMCLIGMFNECGIEGGNVNYFYWELRQETLITRFGNDIFAVQGVMRLMSKKNLSFSNMWGLQRSLLLKYIVHVVMGRTSTSATIAVVGVDAAPPAIVAEVLPPTPTIVAEVLPPPHLCSATCTNIQECL
jgi:hypothetical protein